MSVPSPQSAEFDLYSDDYDDALQRGIAVSGEDKKFFADRRVRWLATYCRAHGITPRTVMDFGCGSGQAAPHLREQLAVRDVVGVDVSEGLLRVARRDFGSDHVRFLTPDEYAPAGQVDLVFCNGVFHHIPPAERPAALRYIFQSLRPGGVFALWENNPWNPGTRYVMSRIPFDRDAVTLSPPGARDMLRVAGFEVCRTDFLFIFPRVLRWLRWIEPHVSRLPLGAQYQVLAVKS